MSGIICPNCGRDIAIPIRFHPNNADGRMARNATYPNSPIYGVTTYLDARCEAHEINPREENWSPL